MVKIPFVGDIGGGGSDGSDDSSTTKKTKSSSGGSDTDTSSSGGSSGSSSGSSGGQTDLGFARGSIGGGSDSGESSSSDSGGSSEPLDVDKDTGSTGSDSTSKPQTPQGAPPEPDKGPSSETESDGPGVPDVDRESSTTDSSASSGLLTGGGATPRPTDPSGTTPRTGVTDSTENRVPGDESTIDPREQSETDEKPNIEITESNEVIDRRDRPSNTVDAPNVETVGDREVTRAELTQINRLSRETGLSRQAAENQVLRAGATTSTQRDIEESIDTAAETGEVDTGRNPAIVRDQVLAAEQQDLEQSDSPIQSELTGEEVQTAFAAQDAVESTANRPNSVVGNSDVPASAFRPETDTTQQEAQEVRNLASNIEGVSADDLRPFVDSGNVARDEIAATIQQGLVESRDALTDPSDVRVDFSDGSVSVGLTDQGQQKVRQRQDQQLRQQAAEGSQFDPEDFEVREEDGQLVAELQEGTEEAQAMQEFNETVLAASRGVQRREQLEQAEQQAEQQAVSQVRDQLGGNFSQGEDFEITTTITDRNTVQAQAELTDPGRQQLAVRAARNQFPNAADDLTTDDVRVTETDDGQFDVELTDSGRDKVEANQDEWFGDITEIDVGSLVGSIVGATGNPNTGIGAIAGGFEGRSGTTVKVDDELRDASDVIREDAIAPAADATSVLTPQVAAERLLTDADAENPGVAERATESFIEGAGIIVDVPGGVAGLIEAGEFIGGGLAAGVEGRGGEYRDRSVEAGEQAVNAAVQQFQRRPVETGATTVGALVGTAAFSAGAARASTTAGEVAPFAFQPGEELAGYIGNRATRLVSPRAARRLFPDNEPLLMSEEAAIRTARATARRARTTGGRAKGVLRGDTKVSPSPRQQAVIERVRPGSAEAESQPKTETPAAEGETVAETETFDVPTSALVAEGQLETDPRAVELGANQPQITVERERQTEAGQVTGDIDQKGAPGARSESLGTASEDTLDSLYDPSRFETESPERSITDTVRRVNIESRAGAGLVPPRVELEQAQEQERQEQEPSVDPSRRRGILQGSPRDRLSSDITRRQRELRRQAEGTFEDETNPVGEAETRKARAQEPEARTDTDTEIRGRTEPFVGTTPLTRTDVTQRPFVGLGIDQRPRTGVDTEQEQRAGLDAETEQRSELEQELDIEPELEQRLNTEFEGEQENEFETEIRTETDTETELELFSQKEEDSGGDENPFVFGTVTEKTLTDFLNPVTGNLLETDPDP